MKSIVLITNILTPYRATFYSQYFNACQKYGIKFHVLCMAETEPERNWYYNEYSSTFTTLMKGKTFNVFGIMTHYNPQTLDYIKNLSPDILLMAGSYMFLSNWIAIFRKNTLHCPIIYWNESHKNSIRTYNNLSLKIRELIRKVIFKRIDGFWYGGKMSLDFVKDYAAQDAKFYFMPNLIDNTLYETVSKISEEERREIKQSLQIANDKIVFICPARLTFVKGIHTFMDLLYKVSNKNKCTILIPGDGDMENSLKEKAKKLALDCRFLGYKVQSEMINLYKAADIFLMPSLSDPNPLTCIEALWCGLPLLVSTHVGNYPEVIKPGLNGFVFDYNKPDEAIQKIETIIAKPKEWRDSAKKISKEIAENTYNPKTVIDNSIKQFIQDWDTRKK